MNIPLSLCYCLWFSGKEILGKNLTEIPDSRVLSIHCRKHITDYIFTTNGLAPKNVSSMSFSGLDCRCRSHAATCYSCGEAFTTRLRFLQLFFSLTPRTVRRVLHKRKWALIAKRGRMGRKINHLFGCCHRLARRAARYQAMGDWSDHWGYSTRGK